MSKPDQTPFLNRRAFHRFSAASLTMLAGNSLHSLALAQDQTQAQGLGFPNRPLRIIAPFAPGGGTDFIARTVAARLGDHIGQPVVVENKPGAGGLLGTEYALKQPADGYTMLLVAGSYTVNPSLYKLKFDPVADMTPIIQLSQGAYMLVVNAALPVKTLGDLLALMRREPGRIPYGSSGPGGHLHVVTEYMFDLAGVKGLHVPYKGTGPAITDLIAGNVKFMFAGPEGVMQHVRSGKLRALAVGTAHRLNAYADIPTVAESGVPGYDVVGWHGLIAPRGVPTAIQQKLNREIAATLKSREMEERLEPTGVSPAGGSPEAFGALIKTEIDRYAAVIRHAGIKVEG